MANTRKKTAVERIKLSLWAKKREETKRALRQVAAKHDSLLVITGQKDEANTPLDPGKMQSGETLAAKSKATSLHQLGGVPTPSKSRLKAFAEMVKRGWAALRPTVALPQAVAPVVDEHAKGPVIATPVYPSEDYIVRTSLSASPDGSENIRGLLETFNRPTHGWRTKYKG